MWSTFRPHSPLVDRQSARLSIQKAAKRRVDRPSTCLRRVAASVRKARSRCCAIARPDSMVAYSGCTTSQVPFELTLGGGHVSQLTQAASESARPAAQNKARRKIVFIARSLQFMNPAHHLSRRFHTPSLAAPLCLRTPPSQVHLQQQATIHRRKCFRGVNRVRLVDPHSARNTACRPKM